MRHFRIIVLLFLSNLAIAQQEPLISNYTQNVLSFNPAFAGAKKSLVASFLYNKQFTGMESGVVQQNFSIHTPISYQRFGIGATFYKVNQDIFSFSVYSASFAYKVRMFKGHLAGGISAGMYQLNVDRYSLQIQHPEDPLLKEGVTTYTSPDLGAGLFYFDKSNSVGFSSQHLLQGAGSKRGMQLNRHYYLILSKRIGITHNSATQLATKVRYAKGVPLQGDLSAYYLFKDLCKVGLSYRTSGVVSLQASLALKTIISQVDPSLFIAYAYDYNLGAYQVYTKGSHEIMVSIELASLKKPGNEKPVISPLMF